MDTTSQISADNNNEVSRIRAAARAIEKAIEKAGIPEADKEAFLNWTVSSLWDSFKSQRMNQRLIIENEIKALAIKLPNGTVKKEYATCFNLPLDSISDPRLSGAEELGLTFDVDADGKASVHGKPLRAGDFVLKLCYNTVEGEPESVLPIPVAFNPNPRDTATSSRPEASTTYTTKSTSMTPCAESRPPTIQRRN